MSPRIILADDHVILREGLRAILKAAELEVVGEASDGAEAVELCHKLRPDLAVLDISMPLLNGIDAAHEILEKNPQTRIILLTVHTEERYILQALRCGIKGYLLKDNAGDELVNAIRAVCRGATYLASGVSHAVLQAFSRTTEGDEPTLEHRERRFLQLVAEGKTMKEIAMLLGVSRGTADSLRAVVMKKLGVHDTANLVRWAIRMGLIPD